jgi:hypothetical protein
MNDKAALEAENHAKMQQAERDLRAKLLETVVISWDDERNQRPLSNAIRAAFEHEKEAGRITQASLREDIGIANATLNSILHGGRVSLANAVKLHSRLRFNLKKATHPGVHGLLAEYMGLPDVPGSDQMFKDRIRYRLDEVIKNAGKDNYSDIKIAVIIQRVSDDLDEIRATKEEIEKKIIDVLLDGFQF